ncbi:hypothetical protein [Oxynema aestuarii]|uniref:Uncharacterized protein n=1 Tax=Oxynema aestuarii AP17 TaxID=2064643 RepID=A0A6H1TZP5_9CYAN|nr:hypothetical protein [Oxynema aestuarii]QIZ71390.1 hypothetical protein HCG48_13020 [Oxynema aestuarii AP17]
MFEATFACGILRGDRQFGRSLVKDFLAGDPCLELLYDRPRRDGGDSIGVIGLEECYSLSSEIAILRLGDRLVERRKRRERRRGGGSAEQDLAPSHPAASARS